MIQRINKILLFFIVFVIVVGLGITKLSAENTYVPGQIIVKVKSGVFPQNGISAFSTSSLKNLLPELSGHEIRQVNQVFQGNSVSAQSVNSSTSGVFQISFSGDINEEALAHALGSNPNVSYAQLNHFIKLHSVPNDHYYGKQGAWGQTYDDMWAFKKIKADEAWDFSKGDGVVVAVIDTGVDYSHPELRGRVIKGYDFSDYDDEPLDEDGHGTHVAGIIAAAGNNNIGIAGISSQSRILAIKIFPHGTEVEAAQAIRYAADHASEVDVINMSWGIYESGYSPLLNDAIEYAARKGIVLVASAGNEGSDVANITPANHPDVIAVSASDENDNWCSFSNKGEEIDVAAPGGGSGSFGEVFNVLSLKSEGLDSGFEPYVVEGRYLRAAGTSMSAPFVSGLAALIRSKNHELTKYDVEEIIKNNADDFGAAGKDSEFGFGRINAYRALAATPDPSGNVGNYPERKDDAEAKVDPPEWVKKLEIGDIAFDNNNNMYVVYTKQGRIVKYKISPDKDIAAAAVVSSTKAFQGSPLHFPMGIAVSHSGDKVFVADTFRNRILVYDENFQPWDKISGRSVYMREYRYTEHAELLGGLIKGGESEYISGHPLYFNEEFNEPFALAVDKNNNLYVADSKNLRILKYNVSGQKKINFYDPSTHYLLPFDDKAIPSVFSKVRFEMPLDNFGNIIYSHVRDTPQRFYTNSIDSAPRPLSDSTHEIVNPEPDQNIFSNPIDVETGLSDNFYVADAGNNCIYAYAPDGSMISKFGVENLNRPSGIEIDSYNNIFVADKGNRKIMQFDSSGNLVREYKSEDGEIAPQKIVVKDGKIYIADANSDRPLVWNIAGDISNVRVSESWFSPNADGNKDGTIISYDLSQPADISVQVIPKISGVSASSAGGLVLDNVSRVIGQNEESWDGMIDPLESNAQGVEDNARNVIADGDYSLKIAASFGDYVKSKSVDIHVDTEKPSLALNRDPPAISPNGDSVNDGLIIDYSLSDNLSPASEVKFTLWKNGTPLKVIFDNEVATSGQPSTDTLVWNGKIANYVIEGDYVLKLEATDLAGNTSIETAEVLVDNSPPRIEQLSISNQYFSPNNDGKKDETEIAFNLSDTFSEKIYVTILLENFYGVKVSTILKREELQAGQQKFVWEGNNENGLLPDGEYIFRIYAEDLAGNLGTAEPVAVVVDTVPPSINIFAADPNPFSPNNDGVKDRTLFSYNLSEPCYAEIRIFQNNNILFRDHRLYNVISGEFVWDGSGFHGGILGEDHPYYLCAEDRAGNIATSETETIVVQHEPSLVPYAFAKPDPFAPVNPDNGSTEIKYYLSRDNLMVTVEVVGKEGRVVKSLVNGEVQNRGEHSVAWHGDYDPSYDGPKMGSKVADGSWEFKVEASASDVSTPSLTSNTVLVDNIPPYILTDPVMVDVINQKATVKYSLPETSSLEIAVYDIDNNLIEEIEKVAAKNPGIYLASWQPNNLPADPTYFKVSAIDKALNQTNKSTELFSIVPQEPLQITNHSVSPNPFTPNGDGLSDLTRIAYRVTGGAPEYTVSINILTETSATVKTLVENEPQATGAYVFYWDGKNDANQLAGDDIYYYEIVVEDKLGTRVEGGGAALLVSTRPTVNLSTNLSTFSPNGDGSSDTLTVDYSIAYPMQYITGEALVKLAVINSTGEAVWERIFDHTAGSYNYEYDGTATAGTSLSAGSYYMKASAEDALGATAIPKMVEFTVDYTQPEPSDFSITPQYARLGVTVSIQLEFEEELAGTPEVNVVGLGQASLESSSGNSYTYSYTVDSDDPEGITTVSVEAQDLALNTISRTNTFVVDKTNPEVSNITASPNPASIPSVSGHISIQFNVNEALKAAPKVYVTQNEASPQLAVVSGDWDQANGLCEGKYNAIVGYDGSALITIEVTDLAGNVAIQEHGGLVIDTISPAFSNIQSEINSNPDFTTFAKEGSEVSVRFQTSENLIFNPVVRVNGESADYQSLNSNVYDYRYAVDSSDNEGNAIISISGFDFAGNNGTAVTSSSSESFVIDLTNPTVAISFDPGMIANPSPFSTNASSEVGHRQTRLQYETSEHGLVTVSIYKLPNAQTSYSSGDFGSDNLVISYAEGWLGGGTHYRYWDGEIQNNQANYDKNGNGFADPGKYAFIVEVKDRAWNLLEGKWGGTCWIQDNLLVLESPDQVIQDNPYPQYFSPNNDGTFEVTEVFFRVKLGVTPAEPELPERIAIFGLPGDFKWLEGVVKTVGSYTVRVYDETKTNLIRTVVTDAPLYSNTVLSETWDGKDDSNQYVSDGTYQIEIDARDFVGGAAEDNLLTLTATVDVSAPQVVSNEPDLASTLWTNVGKSYDVDFFDNQNAYASRLKDGQYKVTTGANQGGSIQIDWTDIFSDLNAGSYSNNWGSGIFNSCGQGTYYVSVKAVDNAGNETVQNDVFYVKKDTVGPPANAPTTLTPTNNQRPTWNWTASSDMSGIQGYYVKLGTSAGSGNIVGETWIGNTTSWQTPSDLSNGMYFATVKVKDNAGNNGSWGSSGSVAVDISPPVISGVSDSPDPFSPGNIDGNKDSITFYYTINETSTISVFVDGSSKHNDVKGVGSHSWVWSPGSSIAEGNHTYYIQAVDSVGNVSIGSNYGLTVDNTPPSSAPARLKATTGNGVANLTWNSAVGADGYDVYRATSYNGSYGKVNSALVTATSYQNGSLANATRYWFKVKAADNAGNQSGFSNYAAATPGVLANTKILFNSNRDGDNEIYRMDADGSNQVKLTDNVLWESDPAYLSGGTEIAFIQKPSGGVPDIYKMNSDGSNIIRLTNNNARDYNPNYAPDGTKIVFDTDRDSAFEYEIYVMNSDGSNQTRLTNNSVWDRYASFSPDGTMIVFYSERDGNLEIYKMNAGGSNPVRLTNQAAADAFPAFSPDGTEIVYCSKQDGSDYDLYIIDSDGSNQRRVTNNTVDDFCPRFSPDGTKIVFHSLFSGQLETFKVNIDGSNSTRLTNNAAFDVEPFWSPFAPGMGASSVVKQISTQQVTFESPILFSPQDQASVSNIRPTFQWEHRKTADTEEYRIDLAENDTFAIGYQTFTKSRDTGSQDKDDPTLHRYTYSIHEFDPGLDRDTYYWKVTAVATGESATSEVRSFTVAPQLTLTGVTNYPNPFNPGNQTTKIRYRLGADADEVRIRIYDVIGSLVAEIDGTTNGEGSNIWSKYNDVEWNGRNGRGDLVVNGIYPFEIIARLGNQSVSARGKIAVLK
jgi:Tol biopolymer transport system component/subtilisin family serine protease/flagellar hook assembly protein FlgD